MYMYEFLKDKNLNEDEIRHVLDKMSSYQLHLLYKIAYSQRYNSVEFKNLEALLRLTK